MRLSRIRFAAAATTVLAVLPLLSAPANAYLPCLSGKASYFRGYFGGGLASDASTFEGASGTATVRRGELCDDDKTYGANANVVWTMLAAHNSYGAGRGYAQVGYFRGYAGSTYFFTQYKKNSSSTPVTRVRDDFGVLPNGRRNQYWVQFINGALRLNVDTTIMATTSFNPYATDAFAPTASRPMQPQ